MGVQVGEHPGAERKVRDDEPFAVAQRRDHPNPPTARQIHGRPGPRRRVAGAISAPDLERPARHRVRTITGRRGEVHEHRLAVEVARNRRRQRRGGVDDEQVTFAQVLAERGKPGVGQLTAMALGDEQADVIARKPARLGRLVRGRWRPERGRGHLPAAAIRFCTT